MEAKKEDRDKYQLLINKLPKDRLIYIDESSIESGMIRESAWGKRGEKLLGKRSGKYFERTNIIAGYCDRRIIAPGIFCGSCDTELFENWVEYFLVPVLMRGYFVIMDNASFHKSLRTQKMIESAGCQLIFLPTYSPDLNPIEKFWANMKRWIRSNLHKFETLFQAITFYLGGS